MLTENKELKKHVATIHCSNSLSLLQRKISNALLFYAYPRLLEDDEHLITVSTMCKIIGYQGNNHEVIKNALRGLISTVIEWNIIDEQSNTNDWTASTILASVRIKGGQCYYAYSPRMKKLLHSPAIYGKINLIIQAKFKSSYGLALYENCVRYQGLDATRWFELEIFRHLMGVPKNKYQIFRDFKKRVLDKSIDEVNTYSNLTVSVELKKQGRKVLALRFKLKDREKKPRIGKVIELQQKSNQVAGQDEWLINQLVSQFQLQEKQISKLLTSYTGDKVKSAVENIINHPNWMKGKIRNPAGFLIAVLKGDINVAEKIPSSPSVPDNDAMSKEHQLKQEYDIHISQLIDESYMGLDEEQQIKLKKEFLKKIKQESNMFVLRRITEDGFEDKMVQAYFRNYIVLNFGEILPILPDYEDFIKAHVK